MAFERASVASSLHPHHDLPMTWPEPFSVQVAFAEIRIGLVGLYAGMKPRERVEILLAILGGGSGSR